MNICPDLHPQTSCPSLSHDTFVLYEHSQYLPNPKRFFWHFVLQLHLNNTRVGRIWKDSVTWSNYMVKHNCILNTLCITVQDWDLTPKLHDKGILVFATQDKYRHEKRTTLLTWSHLKHDFFQWLFLQSLCWYAGKAVVIYSDIHTPFLLVSQFFPLLLCIQTRPKPKACFLPTWFLELLFLNYF